MARRCCWPPESWSHRNPRFSLSPTVSRQCSARSISTVRGLTRLINVLAAFQRPSARAPTYSSVPTFPRKPGNAADRRCRSSAAWRATACRSWQPHHARDRAIVLRRERYCRSTTETGSTFQSRRGQAVRPALLRDVQGQIPESDRGMLPLAELFTGSFETVDQCNSPELFAASRSFA